MPRRRNIAGGFLKPLIILIFLIAFFVFYNAYLVDHSLETLSISLEETAQAQGAADVERVSMLLENAALKEVARPEVDLGAFNAIDLASSIARSSKSAGELKGTAFVIDQVYQTKVGSRSFLLRCLDWLNRELLNIYYFLKRMVLRLFRGPELAEPVVRYDILREAKKLERAGDLGLSRAKYQEFIELNRRTEGIGLIETRLAFIDMKLGKYDSARRLLEESSRDANAAEMRLVSNLKGQIDRMEKVAAKRKELVQTIAKTRDEPWLQRLYLELGQLSTELYDLKGAQMAFKKAIDIEPTGEVADKARFALGFAYKLAANVKESTKLFTGLTTSRAAEGLRTASSIQLAELQRSAGDFEGAAQTLEEVAKTASGTATAVLSAFGAGYVYLFDLGNAHKALGSFREAKRLAGSLQNLKTPEMNELETIPLREYAFMLFEAGKMKEAKGAFEAVLESDENDAWSQVGLGMIYELEGRRAQATKLIEKGYRARPDYFTTAVMAYFEERRGRMLEAVQLNEKSIKLNPDYLYPYYNLGHVYMTDKKYDKALAILQKGSDLAVKLGRKFPLLKSNMGYCHVQQGELDKAIRKFSEALTEDPLLVDGWYNRALAHEKKGDRDAYKKDITEAYRLNPDFKDVKKRALALQVS